MIKKNIKKVYVILFLFAALATCKKQSDDPTGGKDPVIGQTTADSVSWHSAEISTEMTSTGGNAISEHGHCWSTKNNPTTNDSKTTLGKLESSQTFTSQLTGLQVNTTYYIRPYIVYSGGEIYGQELTIQTPETRKPSVFTKAVIDITKNSATCIGINDDGGLNITARGVCWDTTGNPTLENSIAHTTDSTGSGEFTSLLAGLTENANYYVSAYATNQKGTGYGEVLSFKAADPFADFVSVLGGTFLMGSDTGKPNEQPVHTVSVSSFEITKYEITNSQFCEFLNDIGCNGNGSFNDPEYGYVEYIDMDAPNRQINYTGNQFSPEIARDDYPVTEVTWFGARACAIWAGGRLPTEAEWEFAARGGENSNGYIYSGSDNIDKVAWHKGNSTLYTYAVGIKAANELGIYDMSGNVWEWCEDWFDDNYYSNSPQDNPHGPAGGIYRVLRGGSTTVDADFCRVAYRYWYYPEGSGSIVGFRIVR